MDKFAAFNMLNVGFMQLLLEAEQEYNEMVVQGRRRNPRTCWVRNWLKRERRIAVGHYHQLMEELRLDDQESFYNFLRITPPMFDELLERITPFIQKQDTNYRKALEPGMKLAITLRHLATGDSYATLQYDFRVARNTICLLVKEVCDALVMELKNDVITCPVDRDTWKEVAEEFMMRWNVPHACGALDGKHVAIRKPPKTGTMYHNYKGFCSIVLMALVDADYKFMWIDVGGFGSQSDAQIYNQSELKECLEDGSIELPPPSPLPNDVQDLPYFMLGDDAFGLRPYLMKPYSGRHLTREEMIANYRISRARRVVENAFGIMAQRWRVLLSTMQQMPVNAQIIVEACVCLHNFIRLRNPAIQNIQLDAEDGEHNLIPGAWRQDANLPDLDVPQGGNRDTVLAKRQRDYLSDYFNSPAGCVPWQDRIIDG